MSSNPIPHEQQHYYVHADEGNRFFKLKQVLSTLCANLTLIYVDSFEQSQSLCHQLNDWKCPLMVMDPTQDEQLQKACIHAFKDEICMVLIATDKTAPLIMDAAMSNIDAIIHMGHLKNLDQYLARMSRTKVDTGDRSLGSKAVVVYFTNCSNTAQVLEDMKTELGIRIESFDDGESDDGRLQAGATRP